MSIDLFTPLSLQSLPLWSQLCLAGAVAAFGVFVVGRFRARVARRGASVLADQHLMNRLNKLAQMGETDRFAQTCRWIRDTHGPDVLTWMRERAEAEGRTALAARLADI